MDFHNILFTYVHFLIIQKNQISITKKKMVPTLNQATFTIIAMENYCKRVFFLLKQHFIFKIFLKNKMLKIIIVSKLLAD